MTTVQYFDEVGLSKFVHTGQKEDRGASVHVLATEDCTPKAALPRQSLAFSPAQGIRGRCSSACAVVSRGVGPCPLA